MKFVVVLLSPMTTGRFRLLLLLLIYTPLILRPRARTLPQSGWNCACDPCNGIGEAATAAAEAAAATRPNPHWRQAFPAFFTHAFYSPSFSAFRFLFFFLELYLLYTKFSFIYYLLFAFGKLQHFPFCSPFQRNIFFHVTFSNSFFVSSFSCCPTTTEGRKLRMGWEWERESELLPAKLRFVVAGII